jgi:hypothetical protein
LEQNKGIEQMNAAMGNLNTGTQGAVSNSEQVASSAEQLLAQAENLLKSIRFFKTDESDEIFENLTRYDMLNEKDFEFNELNEVKHEEKGNLSFSKYGKGFNLKLSEGKIDDIDFEKF